MKTFKDPEVEADYYAVKEDLTMYLDKLSALDVSELCSCLAEHQMIKSLGGKRDNPLKLMRDAIYIWKVPV